MNAVPLVAFWAERGVATAGASLVLMTCTLKVQLAHNPPASAAITLRATVPTWSLVGVPENMRVAALKASQLGRALLLPSVAERFRVSLASGLVKMPLFFVL